jgi:hypothetical protein
MCTVSWLFLGASIFRNTSAPPSQGSSSLTLRVSAKRPIRGVIMNAYKLIGRTIFAATLTTIAATAISGFAQEATNLGDPLQRALFGRKIFEQEYYYGWPPHRVYPQYGKITIEYAKCEALNWEIIVPNYVWKRADRATEIAHHAMLLVRHNPDITISLACDRVGIEAKETTRMALDASQEKMKNALGATILPGRQMVSGQNIDGIAYFANVEEDDTKTHYAMWIATRNGYSYSLAVFGEKKYSPVINKEMFDFVRDFKQLDPRRVAHAESPVSVADFRGSHREVPASHEPKPFSELLVK